MHVTSSRVLAAVTLASLAVLSVSPLAVRAQSVPSATPLPQPVPSVSTSPPLEPPSPEASPSAAASPAPFVTPTPIAPPAPIPVPIVVERARVGIVPGATISLGVSGGSGALAVVASGPSVDVRYDALAQKMFLTGRAPGRATVAISDGAGDTASVDVLVAPPGGVVPAAVTLELGGTVSPAFVAARIRAAIAGQAQLRPGATVDVRATVPTAPLRAGDSFDAIGRVHVAGGDAYVDATGTTSLHVAVETLAQLDPQILYYSDDPENLLTGTNGVLYRNTLKPDKPARLYFYHAASGSTHRLVLVLQTTGADARVQLIGSAAGPTNAFAYVGHLSTLNYLIARGAQESVILGVANDAPSVTQLGNAPLRSGDLIAGAYDLRVLSGSAVDVAVISVPVAGDPLDYASQPELPGDGHGRRGEFDLTTVPPLALSYAAGTPDSPVFSIGSPTIPNERAGGRALGGDYGVVRALQLQVSNPGPAAQTVYFYEVPVGGNATTSIWFDGDARPTEIPCIRRVSRYTVRSFALAPGQTQTVTGSYMTDGTASFPLDFGLTSTPPSPPPGQYSPDACNPHTPPPAPSPSSSPAT